MGAVGVWTPVQKSRAVLHLEYDLLYFVVKFSLFSHE